MATRRQLTEDLRQQCGNLIPIGKLGQYLGMCPRKTAEFVAGLDCYVTGRKKCYLAIDVAKRLDEMMEVSA